MAVNTEGYVEDMMEGYAVPAESVIGPKITGFDEEATTHHIPYDPAAPAPFWTHIPAGPMSRS